MSDGIINIYKEPGYTSHDVVAKLRGMLHQKRIGHTGTLDPDAEGVLPVCLGKATRICDMLTDESKEYEAVMRLGVVTDTQDMTGRILEQHDVDSLSPDSVKAVIDSFTGDILQIPPMYSAIKVGGRKLYELARAGIEVERKPRRIHIYDITIQDISIPEVTFRTVCSKGTYIRTLCHDIGVKLGCGAAMSHLTRTRVGMFDAASALKLAEVERMVGEGALEDHIITVREFFGDIPEARVNSSGVKKAQNGNKLFFSDIESVDSLHNNENVKVTGADSFLYGIYTVNLSEGSLSPYKMFFC